MDIEKLSLADVKREIYILELIESANAYHFTSNKSISISWDDLPDHLFNEGDFSKMLYLVKITQRLKREGVITKTYKTQTVNGFISFEVNSDQVSKLKKLLLERQEILKKGDRSFCSFNDNSFQIKLNDGTKGVISFNVDKGKRKSFDLFKILYNKWNKESSPSKDRMTVLVTRAFIFDQLKKLRYKGTELGNPSLKTTIGNLRKKIKDHELESVISIDFDGLQKGYQLSIKAPFLS